ncbi:MAG: GDSL-type esterase/lipase family protein [Cyclobacteriaceae bacterium]
MRRILTSLLVCISLVLSAQERPFWNEIKSFQTEDSLHSPPQNAIVFVGSSSFKMWKDVGKAFPDHEVINRGFGGSSLPHVIEYADEIIVPYKPKQVVVYCGENDFMSDTVTSEIVVDRFKHLYNLLRKDLPRSEILFVSMKPSPSRQHLMSKIAVANGAIKDFLSKERDATFINIWNPMLDKNGAPRKELFLKDMLHMNEKGYAIWQKAIEPHLK